MLAVVTNKRLIFIDKGLLYGIKVADIPLRVLNSVIYAKGLIFGSITVSHGSRSFTIKNVNKNTANIFASKTKEQLGDLNKSQSPGYKVDKAVAKSAVEQVRGLKELLDIDAITKEEFEKKKKELLGL